LSFPRCWSGAHFGQCEAKNSLIRDHHHPGDSVKASRSSLRAETQRPALDRAGTSDLVSPSWGPIVGSYRSCRHRQGRALAELFHSLRNPQDLSKNHLLVSLFL
ncbi:hypothetical protein CH063_03808, partial [Colletotrichum higginsianum]